MTQKTTRRFSRIIFPFELMDHNTYINEQRRNRYAGNSAKRLETEKCALIIRSHMNKGLVITEEELPLFLEFHWFVKDRRKDKDNIAFAKKFVLDGMVEVGLIENDGWSHVDGFSDHFYVDKDRPRLELRFEHT